MNRYLMFATIGLSLLMASLDLTMVAVAFPHLTNDLGTNILWAAWTISVYSLALTIVMPLAGNLSDSLGHKRIFLFSVILFTTSSFLCGLAPNIYTLIVFRFFQGLGGGAFLPAATGIVSDLFPENRQSSIGLLSSVFPIGGIIGPNLGGWIVEQYSWRYVFYINIPIGIVLLIISSLFLTHSKPFTVPRIDFRGASVFIAAMFFLMLGLNRIAEHSSPSSFLSETAFFGLALGLFALFLRVESRVSHPILDITVMKSKPFFAANLYNLILGMVLFGVFAFIPLYAVSVYQLSTFGSGMILTPRSVGVIGASAITSLQLRRWGYRWPMTVGLVIASLFFVILGQGLLAWDLLGMGLGKTTFLAVLIFISGIGGGMTMPPSNNACIELMPDKVATITGIRGMFRAIGGVMGVSLITMILHLSSNPVTGFRIAFTSFGIGSLLAFPLAFMMPSGREKR